MAVVINIGDTKHLTFSPLNEKHNILYSRARNSVNIRHIQTPWFDLNPLMDRVDDKWTDQEKYRPEHDYGIPPLESLTIVEDLFSDKPLLTQEFSIGQFWDFLFSEDWSSGSSIRVLEGRLQNLLVTCLVSLIQSKAVVHHSTVAFAKNRRQRYSVYKHSNQEPELDDYEETLLVEFVYYGNAVNVCPGGQIQPDQHRQMSNITSSSDGYPKSTTTTTTSTELTSFSSQPETRKDLDTCMESRTIKWTTSDAPILPRPPNEKPSRRRRQMLRKRIPNPGETPKLSDQQFLNRTLSGMKQDNPPYGILRKYHQSNESTESDDYRLAPTPLDLNKFTCTEKVSYLGEFDLSDDSSMTDSSSDEDERKDSSSDEDERKDEREGFGEEYYLGDRIASATPDTCESVEENLKKRKENLRQARQRRRLKMPVVREVESKIFKEFSELDVYKYLTESEIITTKSQVTENVPDLEEYAQMLKAEERKEMTNAFKLKLKKIQLMKRYNIVKPVTERFADLVGGVTDSQACRMYCYNFKRDSALKAILAKTKKKCFNAQTFAAGGKMHGMVQKKLKRPPIPKRTLEIPYIYITTATGYTYMHPLSKLMMNQKIRQQREDSRFGIKSVEAKSPRRMSLIPLGPTTPLTQQLAEKRRTSIAIAESAQSAAPSCTVRASSTSQNLETKSTTPDTHKDSIEFPKAARFQGPESPDVSSDDESDGLTDSTFQTKKLNIRYSIARIIEARAKEKEARAAKKRNIFDVLRKYYRMQSVLRAFGGGKPERRMSIQSGSIGGLKRKKGMKGSGKMQAIQATESGKRQITIGKLKYFSFLDAYKKNNVLSSQVSKHLFENFPMDRFRENLEVALDKFVVRREVVISDYTAKSSISITFTKKSVFSKCRNT